MKRSLSFLCIICVLLIAFMVIPDTVKAGTVKWLRVGSYWKPVADSGDEGEGNIGWNTGTGSECSVDPGGCTDQDGTRQDLMGRRSNNIGLLDRFGSTGIEDALGGSYGNQLNKLQTTDPKNLLPPVPQTGHSVMNGY